MFRFTSPWLALTERIVASSGILLTTCFSSAPIICWFSRVKGVDVARFAVAPELLVAVAVSVEHDLGHVAQFAADHADRVGEFVDVFICLCG